MCRLDGTDEQWTADRVEFQFRLELFVRRLFVERQLLVQQRVEHLERQFELVVQQ